MKKGAKRPPSNYFFLRKTNATESNTYTYEFELICGPDNSLKNFKFLQKLDYCRVIEGNGGNTKFANYYRSPVDKKTSAIHNDGWKNTSFVAHSYSSGTYEYISRTLLVSERRRLINGDGHINNIFSSTLSYYIQSYAKVSFVCDKYNSLKSTSISKWNGTEGFEKRGTYPNPSTMTVYIGQWI